MKMKTWSNRDNSCFCRSYDGNADIILVKGRPTVLYVDNWEFDHELNQSTLREDMEAEEENEAWDWFWDVVSIPRGSHYYYAPSAEQFRMLESGEEDIDYIRYCNGQYDLFEYLDRKYIGE